MRSCGLNDGCAAKKIWLERAIYGLVMAVLLLAAPFPVEARKVFYFACGLAGIGWALDRKSPDRETLFLMFALAAFALYRIAHTIIETGTLSPRIDAWQVYLSTGNRVLMGLFLVGYLSTRTPFSNEKRGRILSVTLLLSLILIAGHELIQQQERTERGQRATIFSYEVVAVCFAYFGLQLMRQINARKHWMLPAFVYLLALGVVLWTETRTALFCFFIGSTLMLISIESGYKWRVLGVAMLLGAIVLAACYPYLIKPRLTEAYTDVTQYVSGENRATSIGTRFELWKGSVMALEQSPLWGGGYQHRSEIVDQAVARSLLDPVTSHYSRVNMHNELLEELSLRGTIGGALLLLLYSAVAFLGWKAKPKNLALLGVLFVYVFSGLTDALFFSREATVLFITLVAALAGISSKQGTS